MDDTPTFTVFVENILGVNIPLARQELVSYIPTFRQLMNISEEEIILAVLPTSVLFTCCL